MKRLSLALLFCLIFSGLVAAQENQTSYEIALQRIHDAEAGRVYDGVTLDLTGLGLTELPPEIGNLTKLRYLYLGYNNLSSLPSEIGSLGNVAVISLSNNRLSSLPPEFANLQELRELSLSHNQFMSFPPELTRLNNLYKLYLDNNGLSSLPPEIGNLDELSVLSLGYNQLEELPSEFARLTQLYFLDLSGNQFHYLPFALSQLRELERYPINCHVNYIPCDLYVDNNPLISPPAEVLAQGTPAILAYLRNEAWWHLQRLIVGGASALGIVILGLLLLRWKANKGKMKRKTKTG